jgi:nitrate reductase cytochrome c-type subunit
MKENLLGLVSAPRSSRFKTMIAAAAAAWRKQPPLHLHATQVQQQRKTFNSCLSFHTMTYLEAHVGETYREYDRAD